jgi:hypothetical protein
MVPRGTSRFFLRFEKPMDHYYPPFEVTTSDGKKVVLPAWLVKESPALRKAYDSAGRSATLVQTVFPRIDAPTLEYLISKASEWYPVSGPKGTSTWSKLKWKTKGLFTGGLGELIRYYNVANYLGLDRLTFDACETMRDLIRKTSLGRLKEEADALPPREAELVGEIVLLAIQNCLKDAPALQEKLRDATGQISSFYAGRMPLSAVH